MQETSDLTDQVRERAEAFAAEGSVEQRYATLKPWAVLGCGPAGLLAAHALGLMGQPVAVISRPQKSVIGGAQFLHRPIPMLTSTTPDFEIRYAVHGDIGMYREKVYAGKPEQFVPFVSMEGLEDGSTQEAWSLPGIYEDLWSLYGLSVQENAVENLDAKWLDDNADRFRGIVSTVPAATLCRNPDHRFIHQHVNLIHGDPFSSVEDNVVEYCGCRHHRWYRASKIQGVGWREYGPGPKMPMEEEGVQPVNVKKPLWTNCDCNPGVIRAGRMGTWTKGVLVHHAFQTAWKALAR